MQLKLVNMCIYRCGLGRGFSTSVSSTEILQVCVRQLDAGSWSTYKNQVSANVNFPQWLTLKNIHMLKYVLKPLWQPDCLLFFFFL